MEKDAGNRSDFMQDKKTIREFPEIKVLRRGRFSDEFVCEQDGKEFLITKGTLMMLYAIDGDKELAGN